jgi:hypothetical protein
VSVEPGVLGLALGEESRSRRLIPALLQSKLSPLFKAPCTFQPGLVNFWTSSRSTTHLRNRNAVALAYMGGSLLAAFALRSATLCRQ